MRRSSLVLALLAISLTVAACDPPGKGPRAERGYRRSAPVIAALEQYRAARGEYPDSLRMLVPRYLSESALRVPDGAGERYPLEYGRTAEGFALTFRYAGPGMNECTYTAEARGWRCGGRF